MTTPVRRKFREVHPSFNQIQNYGGFGDRWIYDQDHA
jgi:hypothetical protein